MFRSSDVWLNGLHLGHYGSGYMGFRYRVDDKGLMTDGSDNVIAVRVDPRANEGWWCDNCFVSLGAVSGRLV